MHRHPQQQQRQQQHFLVADEPVPCCWPASELEQQQLPLSPLSPPHQLYEQQQSSSTACPTSSSPPSSSPSFFSPSTPISPDLSSFSSLLPSQAARVPQAARVQVPGSPLFVPSHHGHPLRRFSVGSEYCENGNSNNNDNGYPDIDLDVVSAVAIPLEEEGRNCNDYFLAQAQTQDDEAGCRWLWSSSQQQPRLRHDDVAAVSQPKHFYESPSSSPESGNSRIQYIRGNGQLSVSSNINNNNPNPNNPNNIPVSSRPPASSNSADYPDYPDYPLPADLRFSSASAASTIAHLHMAGITHHQHLPQAPTTGGAATPSSETHDIITEPHHHHHQLQQYSNQQYSYNHNYNISNHNISSRMQVARMPLDSRESRSSSGFSSTDSPQSDNESLPTPRTLLPLPLPLPIETTKSRAQSTTAHAHAHGHGRRERAPRPQAKLHAHHHHHALSLQTQQPQQRPPGATAASPAATSNVDCYTCRRRRVKCDRQLPLCAKCERTQLECLGYKKPLVWNKGVASRGKMMGKTFPTPAVTNLTSNNDEATARKKAQKRAAAAATVSPVVASPVTPTTPITPTSTGTAMKREPLAPVKREDVKEKETAGYSSNNTMVTRSGVGGGSPDMVPGEMILHMQVPGQGSPFSHLSHDKQYLMDYCIHPSIPHSPFIPWPPN
jgi:hypothetical protein